MMKAIGASGMDIGKMVLVETVFITVIGGLAGTLAAIVGSSLIESYVKGMLPYCRIYPAFKSSRLSPMEAIRSGVE